MTQVRRRPSGAPKTDTGNKVVLGIDQSYTGFAIVALSAAAEPLVVPVGRFEAKKHGQGIDRLNAIAAWLSGALAVFEVGHVCMEGYAFGRMAAREQAGELGGMVKQVLRASLGDPVGYPTIVTPSGVKKFVTGKGNSQKSEMLKAVFQRYAFDTNNDNIADAYGLARIAHALQWPSHDLPKFQVEVLGTLTEHTERSDAGRGAGA